MKKPIPFHPFLFALFPIVFLASANMAYVLPEEIILSSVISLTATLIIYLLLRLVFKNWDRAALITSAFVLWFFSLENFSSVVRDASTQIKATVPQQWLLPTYTVLGVVLLVVCLRIKNRLTKVNYFLNLVAFGLVLYNASLIAVHEWQIRHYYGEVTSDDSKPFQNVHLKASAGTPDIYYIILDGMGSTSTFKKFYNYDNSDFIAALKDKYFYVPSHSRPNYEFTLLSLASSLNMQYLGSLQMLLNDRREYQVTGRMIQRNRVIELLRPLGYKFVNYGSGFGTTDNIPSADVNIDTGWAGWFNMVLLETTVARALPNELFIQAMSIKRTTFFSKIDMIRNLPGPKFVFAHIVLPHPPYLFNEDGSPIKVERWHIEESWDKGEYTAQLKFVQKSCGLVGALLADKHQPIIIMQGDHGPACLFGTSDYFDERMHIFNAYYFPDHQTQDLYDTITPVNSFRVVLNHFFQANLPLLKDETYSSDFQHPFVFTNVSNRLSE